MNNLNNERLAIMVQLAIYEKKYSSIDKKRISYFREDYVYKKNFLNRLIIFIGSIIILIIDYGIKIFLNNMDPFTLSMENEIIYVIKFLFIILIVYTVIGSFKFNYEYSQSEKRIEKYDILSKRLDELLIVDTKGEDI